MAVDMRWRVKNYLRLSAIGTVSIGQVLPTGVEPEQPQEADSTQSKRSSEGSLVTLEYIERATIVGAARFLRASNALSDPEQPWHWAFSFTIEIMTRIFYARLQHIGLPVGRR